MPLWPFIMLFLVFLAVLILPPLVAAYIDHLAERRRNPGVHVGAGNEARRDG